eukprot:jgi/Hompol1/4609/HPOL_000574-RA
MDSDKYQHQHQPTPHRADADSSQPIECKQLAGVMAEATRATEAGGGASAAVGMWQHSGLLLAIWGLPCELQTIVYSHAGTLTQYLHGRLAQPLTATGASLVVAEAFELDCAATTGTVADTDPEDVGMELQADVERRVRLLPAAARLTWEFALVRSASMEAAARSLLARLLPATRLDCDADYDDGPPPARFSGPKGIASMVEGIEDAAMARAKPLFPLLRRAIDRLSLLFIAQKQIQKSLPCNLSFESGGILTPEVVHTPLESRLIPLLTWCAAAIDHIDAVRILLPYTLEQPELPLANTFSFALKCGSKLVPQYLLTLDDPRLVSIYASVRYGSLETTKLLCSRYPNIHKSLASWILFNPIEQSQTDVVWWLLGDPDNWKHPMFTHIRDDAAAFGYMDILQFATDHNIGAQLSTRAMNVAAQTGRIDIVRWLHENTTAGCTTEAMDRAASKGHLDVVMFLHTHRTEGCTYKAIDSAAREGHIDIVRFLHQNRTEGCSFDAVASSMVNGHLEIFKYLWYAYPHHRPHNDMIILTAFRGHLWLLEFILSAESTGQMPINDYLSGALSGGRLGLAEILITTHQATPFASMMTKIAETGCVAAAKWLHERALGVYPPQCLTPACS